jgi:membrane-associated protein
MARHHSVGRKGENSMTSEADLVQLLSGHGIAFLVPLAILEGPIVTILAAWLASLGLLDLRQVIVVVIIADLIGDAMLYLLGRFGLELLPARARQRMGLSRRRLVRMMRLFQDKGAKILVMGKLTHAAGFAVLIAAGAARMPFTTFLATNFAATLPKSLALVALGYLFGAAHSQISNGIYWASLAAVATVAMVLMARKSLMKRCA